MGKYDDAIGSIEFKISVKDILDEALERAEEDDCVGTRLKEMRKEKGLTQKQVQELTRIDQSEVSKIEAGKRTPTLDQLATFAKLYETSMDYLAGETDVKKPYPPGKKNYDFNPEKACQLDGEEFRYD